MYIENQTSQPVTYTSTGPGGGGAACRTPPYTPVPATSSVPAHSDVYPGRRVCFFDHTGENLIDSVVIPIWCTHFRVVLRPNQTADVECPNSLLEARLVEFNVSPEDFRGVPTEP